MTVSRHFFVFFLLLSCCSVLCAQTDGPSLLEFNRDNLQHQQRAMLVLGGWALTNITGGALLRSGTTGSSRRFHEMNALWNTVNLAIAGAGYYFAARQDPSNWGLAESIGKYHGFQKILLFNAGLDVGYVLGGLYLTERAKRTGANHDQLRGYGRAIMLQGGFLFLFDLANYLIASGRSSHVELLLGAAEHGVGLTWSF